MFLVYTTSMSTDTVGDRAVGLDTLSHTNTVAVYEPELVGAVSYTHLTLPTIYSV